MVWDSLGVAGLFRGLFGQHRGIRCRSGEFVEIAFRSHRCKSIRLWDNSRSERPPGVVLRAVVQEADSIQ